MTEPMDRDEVKAIYELSKITSVSKQLMDDFTNAVVMAIFKEYISSYDKPKLALKSFMESWENNVMVQKETELELLASQQDSMTDMVVGQTLADTQDIREYHKEVNGMKNLIYTSVFDALTFDEDQDD